MQRRILTYLVLIIVMTGCGRSPMTERLDRLDELISESPSAALDSLSMIKDSEMTESDRNYFNLLEIKAKDKAFIRHSTDSVIMKLVDYYGRKGDVKRRAESLYYAGRVYSDLGDYPSALRYYQDALDLLPAGTKYVKLRGVVLSNISHTLVPLHLYRQAFEYMSQLVKEDSISNDSVCLVYDLEKLGVIYMNCDSLDKAEDVFEKTEKLASCVNPLFVPKERMYRAWVKYLKKEYDSALTLIQGIPEKIKDDYRFTAYAYASDIYIANNMPDSAFTYARKLIEDPESNNKKIGYQILLSPYLINKVPKDSIVAYNHNYRKTLEEYVRKNGNRQAVLEATVYNYQ